MKTSLFVENDQTEIRLINSLLWESLASLRLRVYYSYTLMVFLGCLYRYKWRHMPLFFSLRKLLCIMLNNMRLEEDLDSCE